MTGPVEIHRAGEGWDEKLWWRPALGLCDRPPSTTTDTCVQSPAYTQSALTSVIFYGFGQF